MNFLKSLSNSIIGPSLPYTIHADNSTTSIPSNTLWKINDGSRKSDNLPVTIFQYNKSPNAGSQRGDVLNYINNAAMAFKSLRLPNLIQTLDVIEESEIVYVITERVRSLNQILNEGSFTSMLDSEDGKLLLLYQVLKGLKYLNVEGGSVLGRLGLENVYLTDTGVWKLGGFELLTNKKTSDGFMLIKNGGEQRFREERAIIATECQNSGTSRVEKLDTFKFGVFIYRIFNLQDGPDGFSLEDVSLGKNVPQFLRSELKKLITPSLTVRPSIEQLWAKWEPQFSNYELIQLFQRFEEYSFISDPEEKYHVLLQTAKSGSRFPRGFQEYKILPELVKYYDSNQTNFDTLQLILTSHQSHQQDQQQDQPDQIFNNAVKPTVFKAFMVPDRTIRLLLLTYLPAILPKLTASEINDKIFPNYLTGFQDSNVKIREESLKQLRGLVPLLYSRQLNNEVLRTLAKLQTDDSKEIKTLTTITLASIAESLDPSTRANVLAIAFTKSLKDSGNEENQTAALLAILSSLDLFSAEIITTKILTVIAPALLEKNVKVRTLAQKVFKVFLEKVYEEVRKLSTEQESAQPHVDEEQDLSIIEQNLRDEFEMLTVKLDPLPPATPENSLSTSSSHVNLSKTHGQKPSSGAATAAARSVNGSFHLDHKIQSNDSLVNLITDTTKLSMKKQHTAPITKKKNIDDEDLLINDDDDGWGQDNGEYDEDAWIEPAPIVKKTTVNKPKVARTVTSTSTASTADSNLAGKPKKLGGSTGGLKLQPKKKLQMKKVISFDPKDDDGDDAGWGDDGW